MTEGIRTTLLVRHLPEQLSETAVRELLEHYGAVEVRSMAQDGKMRGCAFADFNGLLDAQNAFMRLSGMHLMGHDLRVDYAVERGVHAGSQSSPGDASRVKEETQEAQTSESSPPTSVPIPTPHPSNPSVVQAIAPSLGVHYASAPHLEYRYPPIDTGILTNIMNALIAVPKLYTQVLHLMNKMNIPPPFGPPMPTPPLNYAASQSTYKRPKRKKDALLSSDESEIGSENEREKERKRLREMAIPEPPPPPPASGPKVLPVKIQLHTKVLDTANENKNGDKPRPKLSDEELASKRMSPEELKEIRHFANYKVGTKSRVLFLKNLVKTVTLQDLEFLFRRYFASDEEMASQLTIRHMTEGRMKGQAFVTFPDEEKAEIAVTELHGFVFHGKPLFVQYGRTAR